MQGSFRSLPPRPPVTYGAPRAEARDPISRLRTAIDCLPARTREAMLEGIRSHRSSSAPTPTAAVASARCSPPTATAAAPASSPFARAWDMFDVARRRSRRATERELRIASETCSTPRSRPRRRPTSAPSIADHRRGRIPGSSSTTAGSSASSRTPSLRRRTSRRGSCRRRRPRRDRTGCPTLRRISVARRGPADRRAVGAVGGQRVERVGDREHPRRERDLLALQTVRDSRCRPSARGGGARPASPRRGSRRRAGSPRRSSGWRAISAYSSCGQRAGLEQDRVGDADLADVVQQEAELDLRHVGDVEPDRARDARCP